jgi:endonuclease/exonuclease/phosphatase family metal-dependent hydrolase
VNCSSTLFVGVAIATGCVDVGTPNHWRSADEIEGRLALELGPPPTSMQASSSNVLRIATWNVHLGEDPFALAAALRTSPPMAGVDVLMIQEIEAHPGEGSSRSSRLADLLGMTWAYAPAREADAGTHGLAILSRFPLVDVAVMSLPHVDQPIRERERIAVRADLVVGERRVPIVDIHLDLRIGAVDRIRQLHPAVIDLPEQVIVAGDFNTNPYAWIAATVPITSTDAIVGQDQAYVIDDYLRTLGFVPAVPIDQPTFHAAGIDVHVDDVYPRGLPVVAGGVATDVGGSDHWPVWADVDVGALAPAP